MILYSLWIQSTDKRAAVTVRKINADWCNNRFKELQLAPLLVEDSNMVHKLFWPSKRIGETKKKPRNLR